MNEANNLPKAISHKKLSILMNQAKKDNILSAEDISFEDKQIEDFLNSLNNFEEVSKELLNKFSIKNDNIFKSKSSKSIMALGAMEVHLNMALQAMKVFQNEQD
tara:strand:+ start:1940 stop:2251 length:312 start_codon:yes stop_codon:yes gene_type:complete